MPIHSPKTINGILALYSWISQRYLGSWSSRLTDYNQRPHETLMSEQNHDRQAGMSMRRPV
jgi:hypothetical protein